MATITPPRSANLVQANERVRSPLDRLRSYIRAYVWLEGAAVFVVFLALWFWIGLLLDYGTFLLVRWDWVKILPWWVRLVLLIVLSGTAAGLVAFKVVRRLFIEFRDAALALLLERRFPKLLGDRLITAVELSDPEACAPLGFSPAMVRQTIDEAAERVEKVPVREVFDWGRLFRFGLVAFLLTVVAGGVALGAFCMFGKTAKHGYYKFRNMTAIWFERNILLKRSFWDLRSQVQLVEPGGIHVRIARDDPTPTVRALALKYVIADDNSQEGWRSLTWEDVKNSPDLIGTDLPGGPPGDWKPRIQYMLTSASIAALRGDGVPGEIVSKLDALNEQGFQSDESFQRELGKLLDKDQRAQHEGAIFKRARQGITIDDIEVYLNRFDVRRKVEGKELPAKWNIADAQSEGGWRPLRWSDLTPERIGGFAVPVLSPSWDERAGPLHRLTVIGLLAGNAMDSTLRAAAVAHVGPLFQDADLDAVEARLAEIDAGGTMLRFRGDPVLFRQGDVVQNLNPQTVAAVSATSVALGGTPAAALLGGFTRSETARESTDVGLAYIFSRLERMTEMREVVVRVAKRADDAEMGRTLRELVLPDTVNLIYRGAELKDDKQPFDPVSNPLTGFTETSTSVNLKKTGDNLYSGTFKSLKENTTRYWVEAEDSTTAERTVTVLAPPTIVKLFCDEYHPAYLYYRPEAAWHDVKKLVKVRVTERRPDGKEEVVERMVEREVREYWPEKAADRALRGVKQQMLPIDVSSSSGNATRISQVPAGSDLVLRGKVNQTLNKDTGAALYYGDKLWHSQAQDAAEMPEVKELTWEGDAFVLTLENIRAPLNLKLVFQDVNGVKGSRRIDIGPKLDTEPAVEGFEPDTVRRTPEGYKITARARVPFRGIVQDSQGLARVRLAYTIEQDKIGSEALKGNTVNFMGLSLKLPSEAEAPISTAAVRYRDLPAFVESIGFDEKGQPIDYLPPGRQKDMLGAAQDFDFRKLVTRFRINPDDWIKPINPDDPRDKWTYPKAEEVDSKDPLKSHARLGCDLPLWELGLAVAPGRVQPHYKMRLRVEAVDTDLDSDADKDGTPKPHTFATNWVTLRVVSESVLLSEISREEDDLRKKFIDMFENLQNREIKLAEMVGKLESGRFKDPGDKMELEKELNGMIGSLAVTATALEKGQESVVNIRKDYERILKELRVNQVEMYGMIQRVSGLIVEPLLQVGGGPSGTDESAWFMLTTQSFNALRADKVPDPVLGRLNVLKEKKSTSRNDFLRDVARTVGPEELELYGEALLKHAQKGITFPSAKKSIAELSRAIERAKNMNNVPEITGSTRTAAADAKARIQELKDALRAVLDAMDKIADINLLINKLKEVETKLRVQEEAADAERRRLIEEELKKLTNPGKP
jgi:hypothetical protein